MHSNTFSTFACIWFHLNLICHCISIVPRYSLNWAFFLHLDSFRVYSFYSCVSSLPISISFILLKIAPKVHISFYSTDSESTEAVYWRKLLKCTSTHDILLIKPQDRGNKVVVTMNQTLESPIPALNVYVLYIFLYIALYILICIYIRWMFMDVQWLGLNVFIVVAQSFIPVWKLRSCKPCSMAKKIKLK